MRDDLQQPARATRDSRLAPGPPSAAPFDGARPAEPRTWLNRTADEVASWFGDADAAARRQRDRAAGDHTGEGPESYIDSDARIRDEVSQRLTFDPHIDARKITVETQAGAVTLTGAVMTSAERRRAEDIAIAVSGVSLVHNRLTVE